MAGRVDEPLSDVRPDELRVVTVSDDLVGTTERELVSTDLPVRGCATDSFCRIPILSER